jgi:hypothetical protein
VFDVKNALATSALGKEEASFSFDQTRVAIIRCHHDSVKRIATEDSPDLFLSVSEVRVLYISGFRKKVAHIHTDNFFRMELSANMTLEHLIIVDLGHALHPLSI